jgi:hypothetical protein
MRGAERKGREQAEVVTLLCALVRDLALEVQSLAPEKASLQSVCTRAAELLQSAERLS